MSPVDPMTVVDLLYYLGLTLLVIGYAWLTHRTFSEAGWASFKRFFIEDRPTLLMMLGVIALLLALGLKLALRP